MKNTYVLNVYGCNRLLLETFEGVYRCKNYIKGAKEDGENRNTFQATKSK